jgi:hypothetical protein
VIRRFSPAAVLLLVLLSAAPARAGTEEFSTFSVEAQDEDDESLIDHMLTRTPRAWALEWERSPQALRTAQGCLTSGQWFDETDLKLRAPLGRRAWFGFDVQKTDDDRYRYQYVDFSFHFPTRFGTGGVMFRPFYDKASQDFALMWDVGDDSSAVQLRLTAGFEDLFNNFWQFRQTRVGNLAEPYLKRPWEPALRLVVRQPGLRAEIGGRYLTPSTKHIIISYADPSLDRVRSLWGALAWASLEATAFGIAWEARVTNQQAASGEAPFLQQQPDARDFRRQWTGEAAARCRVAERITAEARWLYQGRTQTHAPPDAPRTFDAIDRVIQVEAQWSARPNLDVRVGGMHDVISVTHLGAPLAVSYAIYGSRHENRAYLGLTARFGRVSVTGIEGIELDQEPYAVAGIHDKGFLGMQTTF